MSRERIINNRIRLDRAKVNVGFLGKVGFAGASIAGLMLGAAAFALWEGDKNASALTMSQWADVATASARTGAPSVKPRQVGRPTRHGRGAEIVTAAKPLRPQPILDGRARPAISLLVPVLNAGDLSRYRRIFELQASQDWSAADAVAGDLDDPLLMGHVLFERYMHPTGYRSRYDELHRWLATRDGQSRSGLRPRSSTRYSPPDRTVRAQRP